jgi:hypothetical protein
MKKILFIFAAVLAFGIVPINAQVVVDGNPTCEERGFSQSVKVEPLVTGLYNAPGYGKISVTKENAYSVSFKTDFPFIRAVIVKGASNAHVYTYTPPSAGAGMLTAPPFDNGGFPEISHVTFCYELVLTSAPVTISGQVRDAYGKPIATAKVATIGDDGNQVIVYTNSFGYYTLSSPQITAGNAYVIVVNRKGYTFGAKLISANQDVAGLDFVSTN